MGVNVKTLVESFKRQPAEAERGFRDAIEKGEVKPSDFPLSKIFAECFGEAEFFRFRGNQNLLVNEMFQKRMTEAEGAVATTAFQNISGQIVYSMILEKYNTEDRPFSKLIPERQAIILDGEKIAGINQLGRVAALRAEGEPYKLAGVSEDWIFTPPIPDYGLIVPVTWEAIFNDRTGVLQDRISEVDTAIGWEEEYGAVDCLIDENVTSHRYNWRGTVIATYGDNSGTHSWDNLAGTNALADWTDIDVAEQVFNGIVDPYTGLPLMIEPKHLIVYKGLEQTARRILSATEIRSGDITSGTGMQTIGENWYKNKYQLVTSRLLASRLATDTSWFLGDISKAFVKMVAEPLNVVQAPSNNEDEFKRRIVQQYRANKRWAYTTVQPRAIVKNTVA